LIGVDFLAAFGANTLTEQDLKIIREAPNVELAAPLNAITGLAEVGNRQMDQGTIIATSAEMGQLINDSVEFGAFFTESDHNKPVAVIGKRVAEQLFKENVPIGKSLEIRGQEFIVRGIFEEFESTPLALSADFNRTIFIPYDTGKELSGGVLQLYQIIAKPADAAEVQPTIGLLREALLNAHAGQEDFTVLKASETLAITNRILTLLTSLIAAVAAISLLVGGIGIMNIMLVSVTERTREIGIRKATGATNLQILGQFLTEAIVLSVVGGLIGVALSGLANFLIRIMTDLQPVITLPVVLVATGVSLLVGVIFGVAPALKAARKDPIEALRS
jgi:putative ABC transport system permease protein